MNLIFDQRLTIVGKISGRMSIAVVDFQADIVGVEVASEADDAIKRFVHLQIGVDASQIHVRIRWRCSRSWSF